MDFTAFISGLLGASFGSTLVGILLKIWLDHRLTIERTIAQEERQKIQKRREASTAVADILAEWVRSSYIGELTDIDRWRLQTTYWKNILWLDKELLDILFPALAHKSGSASTNELVIQARRVLLGLSKPDITADQLNNWLPLHKVEAVHSNNEKPVESDVK
jgi:hypothetical protein